MAQKRSAWDYIVKYIVIAIGSAIYAAGFQFFMYPNDIIVGGLAGIAMIINFLTSLPVGLIVIVLNIPLFALGWRRFGTQFMVSSLFGMAFSSVLVDLFATFHFNATEDLLLACLYGGALKGIGLGTVYYVGSTTGGTDIMAKFVRLKYPYMNFGTIIVGIDAVIIVFFAMFFRRYEAAMYAIVANFVVSKSIDTVLYGIDVSKVCYIISDSSRELAEAITRQLHRGVTMLRGEGAYTGADKKVLLCVIKKRQVVDLRDIIKTTDPNAFFVVTDSKDVKGNGFGDIYGD